MNKGDKGDKEDLGEVFTNHLGLVYIPDFEGSSATPEITDTIVANY